MHQDELSEISHPRAFEVGLEFFVKFLKFCVVFQVMDPPTTNISILVNILNIFLAAQF